LFIFSLIPSSWTCFRIFRYFWVDCGLRPQWRCCVFRRGEKFFAPTFFFCRCCGCWP